jgi:hypothetical protein
VQLVSALGFWEVVSFSPTIASNSGFPEREKLMPESVIVDDGGSTRIRRLTTTTGVFGPMDSLLDVDNTGQSSHDLAGSFAVALITYQDAEGHVHEMPISPVGNIEISSDLDQTVKLLINGNAGVKVMISGNPHRPVVHGSRHRRKHCYVVTNSGAIEKVSVGGTLIYDTGAGGGQTLPAGIKKPVIHTSVVVMKPGRRIRPQIAKRPKLNVSKAAYRTRRQAR